MESYLYAIGLGIALSACCGFRVFLPLLVASIGAHFNLIPLNEGMEWMGTVPAMVSFGTAAVLEIGAYYISFVDNLLDTIATPLAVVAGATMAASFLPLGNMDPLLKWGLGIVAGGATAGTIQLGTGMLRLLSSKTTAGIANPVMATGENLAALGGSVASLFLPVLMAVLLLILISYLMVRLFTRKKGRVR